MEQSYKTVSVRMSQELYTALKDLADRDCRSVPSYIRKLLREHIRRLPPEEWGGARGRGLPHIAGGAAHDSHGRPRAL